MFSVALQSGQLGPLMQQFGMTGDVVAAANSGGRFCYFYLSGLMKCIDLLKCKTFCMFLTKYKQ